jgi:hypothetical protein
VLGDLQVVGADGLDGSSDPSGTAIEMTGP